jgi:hypothetical protein
MVVVAGVGCWLLEKLNRAHLFPFLFLNPLETSTGGDYTIAHPFIIHLLH